ncbi:hypothetical protein CHS0354_018012 [Potamilus streckersoni]|uniref:Peptidase S8/S53 domain-containing protein n=1 Tax=Potamilus streckersoni TaxID=2493646 RepID=A0AAE0RNR4_9BIVA|nr:hypothetical protein CHS0354_018012 [Potamilus streckersoni]
MKVLEAWQIGYNGSGIIVSVVDQGLETNHSDLKANVRGRDGKGIIYVWAAGNGGITDNCNADGYANYIYIYTVTISSVNLKGQPAWYSEVCPPVLAVTYSGDKYERNMVTTSNINACESGIEGSSFSAPQAAGMVALYLQANPNLTWRDVQHLIVISSKYQNLTEADGFGFTLNGAGNYEYNCKEDITRQEKF